MQLFVRRACPMIDAAVQRDVDGIPQGSHYLVLKRANDQVQRPDPRDAALQLERDGRVRCSAWLRDRLACTNSIWKRMPICPYLAGAFSISRRNPVSISAMAGVTTTVASLSSIR